MWPYFQFSTLQNIWYTYLIIKSFKFSKYQVDLSEISYFCSCQNFIFLQLLVVFYYLLLEGYIGSNLRFNAVSNETSLKYFKLQDILYNCWKVRVLKVLGCYSSATIELFWFILIYLILVLGSCRVVMICAECFG